MDIKIPCSLFFGILQFSYVITLASSFKCLDANSKNDRSSGAGTFHDQRYISDVIKTLRVPSFMICIQKCLAECLCYFANYRLEDDHSVLCELVKYPTCGVKSGVHSTEAAGWMAVKLREEMKSRESLSGCCPVNEIEKQHAEFCKTICTKWHIKYAQFTPVVTDAKYNWRCYDHSTLTQNTYYYKEGRSYCTREELEDIILLHPEVKSATYKVGRVGESCGKVCGDLGMICSPKLLMMNTVYHFHRLGFKCKYNQNNRDCFSSNVHPIFYPSSGHCDGYINVPEYYDCKSGSDPIGQRLCKCVDSQP